MAPDILLCLVVAISEGDTLKVRCAEQPQMTVRIAYIDAPEKKQPFGAVSRQNLADLCFKQEATVRSVGRDRYGRMVAEVECQESDAGATQILSGLAWVYSKYTPVGSKLFSLQAAARQDAKGLWSESDPVPPWLWRSSR